VGLPRGKDKFVFLQDKPTALALDPIDENNSLRPSPPKGVTSTAPTPRRNPATDHVLAANGGSPPHCPNNWTRGEIIGQGAFGTVYLGMDNDTGQLMAVKEVPFTQIGGAASAKLASYILEVEEEVRLLQSFHHPNIVSYLGTERTKEALHIFLEYVPGGSIASLLSKFGSFRESVVRVYTKQILLGLEYLHANSVIHRDVKGANILVDNTGLVKLADFGASKKIEGLATIGSGFKSVKGTPYWMAPEVITQSGHGKEADIWSVACTVIEMATGKPPWSQYGSQVSAMFHIAKSKGPPLIPEHLSPDCKDFLYLCFNRNWRERPSATRLLQHPFLAGVVCRTVAAPLNNIAAQDVQAATAIPTVRTLPESSPSQQQRERAPSSSSPTKSPQRHVAPSPSRAAHSPAKLASDQGLTTGLNPRMSPLGSHAVHRPGSGSGASGSSHATNSGARRQLILDGVVFAQTNDDGAVDSSNGAQRSAVGVNRNAAFIYDNNNNNGVTQSVMKRPTVRASAPAFASGSLSARLGPIKEKSKSASVSAADSAGTEATLMLPSRNSSRRASQDDWHADQLVSLPSTVALSSDSLPQTVFIQSHTECERATDFPTLNLSTVEQRRPPSRDSYRSSDKRSSKTGASEGPTASSSTATSGKSEFNPMEEPAWAGALMNSLDSASGSGIVGGDLPTIVAAAYSGQRASTSEEEEEEATSVRPARHRPGSGGSVGRSGKGDKRTKYSNAANGKPPLQPWQRSSVTGRNQQQQQQAEIGQTTTADRGSGRTASDGPIVYTMADGVGFDELPWDVMDQRDVQRKATGNEVGHRARASSSYPSFSKGADEEVLIGALRRRAQHNLKASLVVFSKTAHSNTSNSSEGSGNSGSASAPTVALTGIDTATQRIAPCVSSDTPPDNAAMGTEDTTDTYEVTSPMRTHALSPSRIPKIPAAAAATPKPSRGSASKLPLRPPSSGVKTAGLPSPAKHRVFECNSPSVAGGGMSYEAQFRAQREASKIGGSRSAYSTPAKSIAGHPMRTPRREGMAGGDSALRPRPSSASDVRRTPSRRTSVARAL
jgi:serine/threonine protein kinase